MSTEPPHRPNAERPDRRRLACNSPRARGSSRRAPRRANSSRAIAITRSSPRRATAACASSRWACRRWAPDRKPDIGADGKPEIGWIPRPQISCAQDIAEGMGIRTDSPMVTGMPPGRDGVSADQSPARLPDLRPGRRVPARRSSRVEYGNGGSRFLEHKVKKPKTRRARAARHARCRALHPLLALHPLHEGGREGRRARLRGSRQLLDHRLPSRTSTLDSNYSLNTVDICPVGALTSHGFPLQDARLVPQGNQEHLHQLRDRLQHRHRQPRGTSFTARPRARITTSTPSGCAITAG